MMSTNNHTPSIVPGLGDDVAMEVLQWIGAFRLLKKATIISFNMQDYDFWGHGHLSTHLLRQLALGAEVTVMTTPPPGKGDAFRRKLTLLEELDRYGAIVYLHSQLHAKAYLFQDDQDSDMLIVGSANLTSSGFGTRGTGGADLLELALLVGDHDIWESAARMIEDRLIGHPDTMDFATWVAGNTTRIGSARGGP